MNESDAGTNELANERGVLEERLVSAARDFLRFTGGAGALLPIAGGMPIQCVVVGDLQSLRTMLNVNR